MKLYNHFLFFLVLTVGNFNCQAQNNLDNPIITKQLSSRFVKLLEYPIDSTGFPRSMSVKTGEIKKVPSKDWTSGFYVGNLWQLYTLTGDIRYKDYPTFLVLGKGGEDYANERRRLYHIRHRKNADVVGSKQYFALRLLW